MAKVKSIFIRSLRHNFRRCGIAHPSGWVEHPEGTFTPEQIEILKKEPMLIVSESGNADAKNETLDKREAALDEREKELKKREAALEEREKALKG
jgi:hypothetical protein